MEGDAGVPRIDAAEVWRRLTSEEEFHLVCAYRLDERFRQLPLVGAIARSRFDEWIPDLPKSQTVVFYCS